MEHLRTQFAKSIVMIPLLGSLAQVSPVAILAGAQHSVGRASVATTATTTAVLAAVAAPVATAVAVDTDLLHAEQIDTYFKERDMPLAGYGEAMVAAANKHGLDWRLLPAIAVRESSGGKQMCGNNPFGWGSCKIKFKSIDEAIETIALNLGGKNPATSAYYGGTTTRGKLHQYNGTVVPTYVDEVFAIMYQLGQIEPSLRT
ncbi:MAG: hypothetical protein ACYC8S_02635 [Minisyncoccota bacterium]